MSFHLKRTTQSVLDRPKGRPRTIPVLASPVLKIKKQTPNDSCASLPVLPVSKTALRSLCLCYLYRKLSHNSCVSIIGFQRRFRDGHHRITGVKQSLTITRPQSYRCQRKHHDCYISYRCQNRYHRYYDNVTGVETILLFLPVCYIIKTISLFFPVCDTGEINHLAVPVSVLSVPLYKASRLLC